MRESCAAVQASLLVTAIVMATKTMSWVSAVAHAFMLPVADVDADGTICAMMQITAPPVSAHDEDSITMNMLGQRILSGQ